ncbi:MAG: NAD(P)-dependent oxidoreductase [Cyclobacteriaceae bacterium]|nr:alanine dehydrogenase [Cyclobacteriaceae bacterium]MCH8516045.1 NAD(P)-dependent oxidoreductase [Cyclobacteriaceae bacterium]
MEKLKICIIKEEKVPIDRRVALTPSQCKFLIVHYPNIEISVQSSDIRCFSDEEYKQEGIPIVDEPSAADILVGVKEVPISSLHPNKTYFFFSHTIKKQAYNRPLLQEIIKKNIRLIDYEVLTNKKGARLIAFGRYAGLVGAYNGIYTYGIKHKIFQLKRAYECKDLNELKTEAQKIKLPNIKIIITGSGRVAKGAMEMMQTMHIKEVTKEDFKKLHFDEPVFIQLKNRDYHRHKENQEKFNVHHFYENAEKYESYFTDYLSHCDLLIAAAYWNPVSPVLFDRNFMQSKFFKTSVIADITCDIEGSIPSTKMASTIEEPLYDYDAVNDQVLPFGSKKGTTTVMAIDNLPCELPRDASHDFGEIMSQKVIPLLFESDHEKIIERATIANNGKLGEHFHYLQDFLDKK